MAKKSYSNKKLKSYSNKSISKKNTKPTTKKTKVMFLENTFVAGKVYNRNDGRVSGLQEADIKTLKNSSFAQKGKILFS